MTQKQIHEIEFEELDKSEVEEGVIDNKKVLMNSVLNIDVNLGSVKRTIGDILDIKHGDILILNKHIDDAIPLKIDNKRIAEGETLIVDNKLNIRILEF